MHESRQTRFLSFVVNVADTRPIEAIRSGDRTTVDRVRTEVYGKGC